MFIRILSDLHLEFGDLAIPALSEDKDTILVLAGDIGVVDKQYTYKYFIEEMAARFREVIYIMGNHEYYHGSFVTTFDKVDKAFAGYDNVNVVNNETISINGVAFICSTMWTDFDNANPVAMSAAAQSMSDYRTIRTGPPGVPYQRKLHPKDTFIVHQKAVRFIFDAINKHEGKKVVVTHHLPSYQSVDKQFVGDVLNSAYATELGNRIVDTQPNVWIHGHTHTSFDYYIGETHILCNPRGYFPSMLNPEFNPTLRIEINN